LTRDPQDFANIKGDCGSEPAMADGEEGLRVGARNDEQEVDSLKGGE